MPGTAILEILVLLLYTRHREID